MRSRMATVGMALFLVAILAFGVGGLAILSATAATTADRGTRPADAPVDIEEAIRSRQVEARPEGAGLSAVVVTIRRIAPTGLRVAIPVGAYFVARGDSQSMIVTQPVTVDLQNTASVQVTVATACCNFHRPEPGSDDRFTIRSAPENKELQRLMAVIARRRPSEVVAQIAIWVVTDNPSRAELDAIYQVSEFGGFGGRPAASNADIEAARKLLEEAGIDTARKRLFR